ncbi:MAG TPA: F0F1 ATP synthase subunit epsilon [Gemmatimonadota bacterium]|nr:F0F1 ATP synthase subunit epsilon [Gemmatimonadota bacterium]
MSDGDGRALTVRVISPDRVGFEGKVVSLVAPAHDGEVGILRGHAPMTVLLGTGELRLRTVDGEVRRLRVSHGFLQVIDDVVSVLAEEVEAA